MPEREVGRFLTPFGTPASPERESYPTRGRFRGALAGLVALCSHAPQVGARGEAVRGLDGLCLRRSQLFWPSVVCHELYAYFGCCACLGSVIRSAGWGTHLGENGLSHCRVIMFSGCWQVMGLRSPSATSRQRLHGSALLLIALGAVALRVVSAQQRPPRSGSGQSVAMGLRLAGGRRRSRFWG